MANIDDLTGFKPVRYVDGRPYTGAFMKCYSDDDALAKGDLVEIDTTSVQDQDGVYPTVGRYEQGDDVYGVVVGWEVDPAARDRVHHAASTKYAVHIAHPGDLVMEVQSDDATMTQNDVGLNVDVVVTTTPNTTTGASNMEIDGDTANTTGTLDMKIVGMVDNAGYDITDSIANQKFLVVTNKSYWADQKSGL